MPDTEHLRSFLDREAAEEFQFHDALLLWVDSSKLLQCLMQSHHVELGFSHQSSGTGDRKPLLLRATSFRRFMLARMVHQNAAHELCRNTVKLRAVLPFGCLLID